MTIDSTLLQREGEQFLDWKMRLVAGKFERTHDLDWVEIRDLLQLECSSDHLRKTANGAYEMYKHLQDKTQTTPDLNGYSLGKYEIEMERKKLQTDRLELNKILRESARQEMFFEQVRNAIETVEPPSFYPLAPRHSTNKGAVLSFADIHWGKKFKSINNEYSEEIAINRMNELLSETILIGQREGLEHIHVQNIADSIEGMALRISQLQSLQFGMVDQTIRFSRMMVEWLNTLSKNFKISYHHVNSANHSELRVLGTKRNEMPLEDMERIISAYIHDTLKYNERIEVPEYNADYVRYEVCDNLIYALHGHQIGNVNKVIQDLSMKHREFIDTVYLGHFHHENSKTVGEGSNGNCRVIIIPSIMGTDEYADSLMTGAKAGARFDIYEQDRGNTVTYNITLN